MSIFKRLTKQDYKGNAKDLSSSSETINNDQFNLVATPLHNAAMEGQEDILPT